ncbi:MAG: nucleoside hydrolase [Aerococcaceae bacterium]|nr:nucleoside hydrolase [Aerococcaceae bacterium]
MVKKIFIDCDPGVDDAIALVYAFNQEQFEVVGVSSVSGNVGIDVTTRNLAHLLPALNCAATPLIQGYSTPIKRTPTTAEYVHGDDGLGGNFSMIEQVAAVEPVTNQPSQAMYDCIMAQSEKVAIFALGPLTNVAYLLQDFPEVKTRLSAIYIMGGGLEKGNITPHAEFNFYVDPEAVAIVLQSRIELHLVSLNVTEQAVITDVLLDGLREIQSNIAQFSAKALARYGEADALLHDPLTFMVATHPEWFSSEQKKFAIDTSESATRGQLFEDETGGVVYFYTAVQPSVWEHAILEAYRKQK